MTGVACVLSIYFLDQKMANLLTEDQYKIVYRPVREITELGVSTWYFSLSVLVSVVCGLILKFGAEKLKTQLLGRIRKLYKWSILLFISLIASGAMVQILKFLVGRQRPHRTPEHNPMVFDPMTSNWHFHSFPSGHTQTVFTVAMALFVAFPKWRRVIFGIAVLVAMTRVILHEHFLSDLMMGAYVGCVMTWIVYLKQPFFKNRIWRN